ncbi:uncharacterized protein involved in copper resistance [Nocardioides thalensis]|uniref:Uncharacterized protein involved in copper resistance n=1 Tax=Nocardioides thalensis TaxID=1914755 RepID=A0A853C702_9ACTN|nr:hypothetical protein [Nocardioides thalensis]NYJ03077.1 uncharacterized protein involved in copper resistance [Nocardioides thalensis]
MARKNPLGKVKDVAVETLKAPATVAGSAVGIARDAVTSLVGGKSDPVPDEKTDPGTPDEAPAKKTPAKKAPAKKPAAKKAPAKKEATKKATAKKPAAKKAPARKASTEPVNVTEELGLDPAPVAKKKDAAKDATKPVTDIDAAADPSTVDVTPADVAKQVGNDG